VQICSNLYHCAAVTSTGELYTCGDNTEGQVQPSEGMKAEDAPQGDDR
jgi:alpha-tubulin suppressor-like RCC1 family protein